MSVILDLAKSLSDPEKDEVYSDRNGFHSDLAVAKDMKNYNEESL
jgi:hypothetical protein